MRWCFSVSGCINILRLKNTSNNSLAHFESDAPAMTKHAKFVMSLNAEKEGGGGEVKSNHGQTHQTDQ